MLFKPDHFRSILRIQPKAFSIILLRQGLECTKALLTCDLLEDAGSMRTVDPSEERGRKVGPESEEKILSTSRMNYSEKTRNFTILLNVKQKAYIHRFSIDAGTKHLALFEYVAKIKGYTLNIGTIYLGRKCLLVCSQ